MKHYDFESINKMSIEQKKQILPKIAKTANKRLAELEKHGLTKNAYEKAMKNLAYQDRERFYTGSNYKNHYDVQKAFYNLEEFMNSKSSTVSGYKRLKKQRIKIFKDKFAQYNKEHSDKQLNLDDSNIDDFYDFLSSEQFRTLGQRVDSNQVIEDFIDYIAKYDIDTVRSEFDLFLQGRINTFEQVGERLNATKGKRIY